jgi:hypothetical protein
LLASERLTDEPWEEIPERALIRVERGPSPHLGVVSEAGAAAEPELLTTE